MKPIYFAILLLCASCAWSSALAHDPAATVPDHVSAAVAQLSQPDADLRWRAKLRLLRPEARPYVKSHQSEVLSALANDWEDDQSALILGQLELPAGLRNQLRDSPRVPDAVRARLGDAAAEQRVIAAFQAGQTNVGALYKTADDLLYADTPAAWQAFGQALASRQVLENVRGNQVSVVAVLIRSYGEAHQEEPLFAPQACNEHANVSLADFQKPVHQAFLRQLENRLRVRHNLTVTLNPPLLFNTSTVEKY
jgi:hypothetical protein